MSNNRQLYSSFNSLPMHTPKETQKCRISGPLWGESCDRWIPLRKGATIRKAFSSWRHAYWQHMNKDSSNQIGNCILQNTALKRSSYGFCINEWHAKVTYWSKMRNIRVSSWFSSQSVGNMESVSMWWRHQRMDKLGISRMIHAAISFRLIATIRNRVFCWLPRT